LEEGEVKRFLVKILRIDEATVLVCADDICLLRGDMAFTSKVLDGLSIPKSERIDVDEFNGFDTLHGITRTTAWVPFASSMMLLYKSKLLSDTEKHNAISALWEGSRFVGGVSDDEWSDVSDSDSARTEAAIGCRGQGSGVVKQRKERGVGPGARGISVGSAYIAESIVHTRADKAWRELRRQNVPAAIGGSLVDSQVSNATLPDDPYAFGTAPQPRNELPTFFFIILWSYLFLYYTPW
jgi:hypothetical protein